MQNAILKSFSYEKLSKEIFVEQNRADFFGVINQI